MELCTRLRMRAQRAPVEFSLKDVTFLLTAPLTSILSLGAKRFASSLVEVEANNPEGSY